MYTPAFTTLKESYESRRGIAFTYSQFAALLYTMPSILIAFADGKIDETEADFIKDIPASLLTGYRNDHRLEIVDSENMPEAYLQEVKYLLQTQAEWKQPFIEALREELQHKQNDKNTIYDIMWKAAFSSKNVNEEEVERIKSLTKELGF
jgi:uncharacterized membrane protein YebE (DUF533 family)